MIDYEHAMVGENMGGGDINPIARLTRVQMCNDDIYITLLLGYLFVDGKKFV
jgi:hypothetical protein